MRYLTFTQDTRAAFATLTAALVLTDAKLTPAEMRTALKVDAKLEDMSTEAQAPEVGRDFKAEGAAVLELEDAEHALVTRMVQEVGWRAGARKTVVAVFDLLERAPHQKPTTTREG